MYRIQLSYLLVGVLCAASVACASGDSTNSPGKREELPGGGTLVRHGQLPSAQDTAEVDLVIGKVEGQEWETFGRIRGIAADRSGVTYVLDQQASAVRVYSPSGVYLRSLGGPGGGPGEIQESNGIVMDPAGNLWIHDYAAGSLLVVDRDGRELRRHPMLYPGYGVEWVARIDTSGMLRQAVSHAINSNGPPETQGVYERRLGRYVKSFALAGGTYDSVHIGEWRSHYVRIDQGGSRYMSSGVPYASQFLVAIGPDGGAWVASSDNYRIAHVTPTGDTTVIVEAAVPLQPLTDENQQIVRRLFQQAGAGGETSAMPKYKPVVTRIIVDDEARLWVHRADSSSTSLFDVFTRDGAYSGSLRTRAQYLPYPSPVVVNRKIYGVTRDSLDVSYVSRTAIPDWFQRTVRK